MKINNNFTSIEQITGQYLNNNSTSKVSETNNKGTSFEELLKQKQELKSNELKFSKHASERLSDRNIELTNEQVQRLNDATAKASEKGIKETLVLVDNMAFIVNIKNNLVVTAMDSEKTNGNVFTNIDGAVIN